jgi:hypothetical protein
MNTKFNTLPDRNSAIVYIREIAVSDLPEEMQEQAAGLETIFAVHRANGERVALVADKRMAFALARQNDMAPVSVH